MIFLCNAEVETFVENSSVPWLQMPWLHVSPDHQGQDIGYRQVSNIRRTKFQQLKDYRTVLRLSLPNPLKPDVKSRMKM